MEPPANIWDETKYDKEELSNNDYKAREKRKLNSPGDNNSSYFGDNARCTYFEGNGTINDAYPEFSGFEGGGMGGAGANGDWSGTDNSSDSNADSSGNSGGDVVGCSSGCGGD